MDKTNDQLDRLVADVLTSSKYKDISSDLIRNIGSQELAKRRNLKEALKTTKNKLHQIGGAYLDGRENYMLWLDELRTTAQSDKRDDFLQTCKKIMGHHASTRERLPILDQFYTTILADLPPIRRVLDLACGLSPLAIPWMQLSEHVEYYACDLYQNMMDFLNKSLPLMHVQGHAQVCDLIQTCPTQKVDVAFLLKTLPCLEQVDKSAGSRILHTINAQHLVVSFPIHSLGGRDKGMVANYEARFYKLVEGTTWSIKRFEFATELAYVVTKSESTF